MAALEREGRAPRGIGFVAASTGPEQTRSGGGDEPVPPHVGANPDAIDVDVDDL
jgi:hypothetical protein